MNGHIIGFSREQIFYHFCTCSLSVALGDWTKGLKLHWILPLIQSLDFWANNISQSEIQIFLKLKVPTMDFLHVFIFFATVAT